MTGTELAEFCISKKGTNYVYGMKGAIMTLDKYNWLYKTYGPSNVWPSDKAKVGTVCTDCSGIITWACGVEKNSSGFKSAAKEVLPIERILTDGVPGMAVWYSGHIGVYIGNGRVIEARGSRYGVVETGVLDRPWTHCFKLHCIEYPIVVSSYYIGPFETEAEARATLERLPQGAALQISEVSKI